jgi:hypothetical protein
MTSPPVAKAPRGRRGATARGLLPCAVPAAMFVGLTLLRTDGITSSLWLFDDQIRYWETALLPLWDQPLVGPRTHVGGYALGPAFYWVLWLIRVTLGPWVDNLPHAGAIGQVLLASAADTLLLVAVWRRTTSVWLAMATVLLLATAPYDLALSSTIWNPIMAAIAVKAATALVLLRWPERSLTHAGATATLAWTAMHCNLPAVFPVAGIFAAIILPPFLTRDYRAGGMRAVTVALVVLVLQLPYLAHRIWRDPGGGGVGAVTDSLGQVLGGSEALRFSESAASLAHAVNRIQVDPWQASWIGWVLVLCGAIVLVRHRQDWSLLAVTVVPLVAALVGYTFWVADYDDYYYLSIMPAAVLTFQFGLTALVRGPAAQVAAVALCVVTIAILPVRVGQSATIHRMPGYGELVDGSRQILKRDVAVREIRADFLPPGSDPEFLFRILGGRVDPDADWVASVAADGIVSYERVSPG